jgi:hypothetical protein
MNVVITMYKLLVDYCKHLKGVDYLSYLAIVNIAR